MQTFYLFFLNAFVATSAMTVFSYVLSVVTRNNFREPYLLSLLIKRLPFTIPGNPKVSGWLEHYMVGVAFVTTYYLFWDNNIILPTLISGIILGIISGCIGLGIWMITLKVHPNPPYINRIPFYLQLLPAHVVFAVASTSFYILTIRVLLII